MSKRYLRVQVLVDWGQFQSTIGNCQASQNEALLIDQPTDIEEVGHMIETLASQIAADLAGAIKHREAVQGDVLKEIDFKAFAKRKWLQMRDKRGAA